MPTLSFKTNFIAAVAGSTLFTSMAQTQGLRPLTLPPHFHTTIEGSTGFIVSSGVLDAHNTTLYIVYCPQSAQHAQFRSTPFEREWQENKIGPIVELFNLDSDAMTATVDNVLQSPDYYSIGDVRTPLSNWGLIEADNILKPAYKLEELLDMMSDTAQQYSDTVPGANPEDPALLRTLNTHAEMFCSPGM